MWLRIISAEIAKRTPRVFHLLSKFSLIVCFSEKPGAGCLTYFFVCDDFQTAYGFDISSDRQTEMLVIAIAPKEKPKSSGAEVDSVMSFYVAGITDMLQS